jgi:phage terminase large subunit
MAKVRVSWEQTEKQAEVWDYLTDDVTTDILFGGGAGGAKSFTGCAWIIIMCGMYPGTRWVIGRKKLKTLKETTLQTFWDVCRKWNIKEGRDFKFNAQDNVIRFSNGSEVLLKDLFLYPADPNFDNLGSLEITGAFVDEVNQVVYKSIEVLKSRMRYKLDEFGLIPKLLMTCNPAKNWVFMEFYKPFKEKVLEPWKRFVQSLAKDNPFLSKFYRQQLARIKDKNLRERLEKGNWEYDDDPAAMFSFDIITDLFTSQAGNTEGKFISGDISRKGDLHLALRYPKGHQQGGKMDRRLGQEERRPAIAHRAGRGRRRRRRGGPASRMHRLRQQRIAYTAGGPGTQPGKAEGQLRQP